MKNKKICVICLLVFGLVICGFTFLNKNKQNNEITLYGNIDIRQVNLAFRTAGRVESLKVEEGNVVKKGDLLATIDDEPILNKLNQVKAQLKIAKIQMQNANKYFNRNTELCKKKTISKQECDNITLKKEEANANYEYTKALYDDLNTTYNDCKLYSPSDGIVLIRVQDEGAIVNTGTPIYTLSLNDEMWAKVYIDETDLGKVKIGSQVRIYTDSTTKVYNGHVGFISPVAEFTPKNIETTTLRTDLVYKVKVVIDDADDYLKQGMPITVKIQH